MAALLVACVASVGAPSVGHAGGSPGAPTGGLQVFAGILPLAYLAERIGGDRVSVATLVQPGQDPHTFEPTPRQIAALTAARLYFQVGLPFEAALVERMRSMPALRVVDTRQGIDLMPVVEDEAGGGAGPDPHVWMDPLLARRQAQTVRDALVALDPAGKAAYEAGYDRLARDLEAVRQEVEAALAPYRGRDLFVFHPAFGYFARAFGLTQVAVETGGKEPSARELARLIDRARERGVKVIFVQPQFSQAGARAVADAIGGVVVPIDDLAYDYVANLAAMARVIARELGGGAR
jgi:zinc transport system substrate-binding protein